MPYDNARKISKLQNCWAREIVAAMISWSTTFVTRLLSVICGRSGDPLLGQMEPPRLLRCIKTQPRINCASSTCHPAKTHCVFFEIVLSATEPSNRGCPIFLTVKSKQQFPRMEIWRSTRQILIRSIARSLRHAANTLCFFIYMWLTSSVLS